MNRTLGDHESNNPCKIPVEQNRQGHLKCAGDYTKETGWLSFKVLWHSFQIRQVKKSETD